MKKITFKYRDKWSKGEWREQTCIMKSVSDCINFYGLGFDCDYRIVKVEDID